MALFQRVDLLYLVIKPIPPSSSLAVAKKVGLKDQFEIFFPCNSETEEVAVNMLFIISIRQGLGPGVIKGRQWFDGSLLFGIVSVRITVCAAVGFFLW